MNPQQRFFYLNAGWSYDPNQETSDEGRVRCATALAQAESWASAVGLDYDWSDDWCHVASHADEYGDEAYPREPDTCEVVSVSFNGEVLASLACIDDATDEYRRVIEAELALEILSDTVGRWSVVDSWLSLANQGG